MERRARRPATRPVLGSAIPVPGVLPRALAALLPLALVGPATSTAQEPPRDVREAVLSIGVLDGPPEEQFYAVRNATRLADGRVVVPDAGSSEIRFFASDGTFLAKMGRDGDGPGEYRSLDWVRPYRGDSLAVFDSRLQRVTVLDGDGNRGREVALGTPSGATTMRSAGASARPGGRVFATGVFESGGFLVRQGELSVGPGDTTAVRRDVFRYVRLDAEGARLADVMSLPDDEQFVWAEGRARSVGPRAFGRRTAVVVRGERVYAADGSAFRVRVLEGDGRTVGSLEDPRPPRPVTDADRKRWTDAEIETLGEGLARRIREPTIRAMSFPETMPPHGRLVVGEDGRVWLEEYLPPHQEGQPTWTVFSPGGEVVERVRFPRHFRLTWAGADLALGVLRDELDVERVVGYRLSG